MIKPKVLITGASSPLGLSLAKKLGKEGYQLFLTARNLTPLQELQDTLRNLIPVEILGADLLSSEGKEKVIQWIKTYDFDLIINNAGMGLYGDSLSHSSEELLAIMNLNMTALLELSLAGAHQMILQKKKGIILNISSAADVICYPTFAVYSASKAFVTQFSRAFHEELKDKGIHVLVSAPGQINTNFQVYASKGYFNKASSEAISCEEAANEILWQLKKKKTYHVFPKKIFFLRWILLHLIPKNLGFYLLKQGIRERYPQ